MKRSKWKLNFVDKSLLKQSKKKKVYITAKKNSIVLASWIGKIFKVHNGIAFIEVPITKLMVGRILGEFILTRKFTAKKSKK